MRVKMMGGSTKNGMRKKMTTGGAMSAGTKRGNMMGGSMVKAIKGMIKGPYS
jgi:hypothetical protein